MIAFESACNLADYCVRVEECIGNDNEYMPHLDPALSAEIRTTVGHLPPWPGDPTGRAINYSGAPVAYAVNVTLIHGDMEWHPAGVYLPTPKTKALLVQRASGEGKIDSWSGVSGFIDVLHDPILKDEGFDPIRYAVNNELQTECGMDPEKIQTIDLHVGALRRNTSLVNLALGQRFEEPRFGGIGTLHVLPVLGICHGRRPPRIRPNPQELSAYEWVPLGNIAEQPNLSPGYLDSTLPNALRSLHLREQAIRSLLRGKV